MSHKEFDQTYLLDPDFIRRATWIARVVSWTCQAYDGAPIPFGGSVDKAVIEEWTNTKERVSSVYNECSDRGRPLSAKVRFVSLVDFVVLLIPSYKRQTHYRMSFLLAGTATSTPSADATPNVDRHKLLGSAPINLAAATLNLLVSICILLGAEDQQQLAKPLWAVFMDERDKSIFGPATFLLMQCAEKAQTTLMPFIHADLAR